MNEAIIRMLKDNIRKSKSDLADWHIKRQNAVAALAEADKMVDILNKGLVLWESQLESVNGGA